MRAPRLAQTVILALALMAAPGAAQGLVHSFPGEGPRAVRAGDFNHDGLEDLAVGSGDAVRVYSGADAALLLLIPNPGFGGNALLGCGDLDHDGTPDLLVGDHGGVQPSGIGSGRAIAYSGATGLELWVAWGSAQSDAFGFTVGEAGDANADGTPDVLVGAWQYAPPFGSGPGYARLLSGVDGSVLHEWVGAFAGASTFGLGLGTLGDLDGDGRDDPLVGELGLNGGVIYAYSGADGSVLKVFDPPVDGAFGMSFQGRTDIDGDGVRDLVATAPSWSAWRGRAVALSGADSSILIDVQGLVPYGTYLGQDVDVLDDLNGDGVPELITCGGHWESLPAASGFALVVSGADSSILLEIATQPLSLAISGSSIRALGDLNGDGAPEFVVGGQGAYVFSSATLPPVSYCPAKTNSQGCTPSVGSSGVPSLYGVDDFHLTSSGLINQSRGVLMWSAAASAPPYLGGTLCLAAPWQGVGAFTSGGSPLGVDCSGSSSVHLGQAFLATAGAQPGTSLYFQFFYRDRFQLDGSGLGLSDGVRVDWLP